MADSTAGVHRDPHMSVESALHKVMQSTEYDPAVQKIRAIKDIRAMTGLGLKEAKYAVDAALNGNGHAVEDEVSLESVLADLSRRAGRESDPVAPTIENGDRQRELRRARDRRYRARVRARLDATRPPVRPTTSGLAWSLVETVPAPQLREWLRASGLTLEIVKVKG
jgi:hypothetical protein